MQNFADLTTPRYQLPFEELPRGFVPFPQIILDHLEKEQARLGCRFRDDYARHSLERQTLRYFYEGIPVAWKPADGGVEIVAAGWEETAKYLNLPGDEVKVIQP